MLQVLENNSILFLVGFSVTITTVGSYASGSAPGVSFTNDASDTTGSGAVGTSVLGFAIASINVSILV